MRIKIKSSEEFKHDFLCILVLFVLTSIFFSPTICFNTIDAPTDQLNQWYPWASIYNGPIAAKSMGSSDTIRIFLPYTYLYRDILQSNELPLWNPYIFCGTPFLADMHSQVSNPFSLLFLLCPITIAWRIVIPLQFFLAGFFMYLFMRELKISRTSSLFSSIIFMFNPLLCLSSSNRVFLNVLMYLPLLLYLSERYVKKANIKNGSYLSIIIALQLFSGHFEICMYSTAFIFFYTLYRNWQLQNFRNYKRVLQKTSFYAVFLLFGFLIAAPQILPTIEFSTLSNRASVMLFHGSRSIPPWHIVTCLIPYYFGFLNHSDFYTAHYGDYITGIFGYSTGYTANLFLGVYVLFFLIWGILIRNRETNFFSIALFASMFWAMSGYLYPFMAYFIPVINTIQSPDRIICIFFSCTAILAGFGLDNFILNLKKIRYEQDSTEKIKFNKLLIYLVASLFFIAGITVVLNKLFVFINDYSLHKSSNLLFDIFIPNSLKYELSSYSVQDFLKFSIENYDLFNLNILIPLIIAFIALIFLFIMVKKNIPIRHILTVIILFSFISLLIFGWDVKTFGSTDHLFSKTEGLEYLQQDDSIFRVVALSNKSITPFYKTNEPYWSNILEPNTNIPYNIQDIRGFNSLYIKRYQDFYAQMVGRPFDGNYHRLLIFNGNYNLKLLSMLNTKYLIVAPNDAVSENKTKLVYSSKDMRIYENLNVIPRAYLVHNYSVVKGRERILETMTSDSFNPTQNVILEENPDKVMQAFDGYNDTVQITEYRHNGMKIKTYSDCSGFLIVSDNFYPGWHVYVNGIEEEIIRANYIMRGVYLDKGINEVEFKFSPQIVSIGLFISLFTLLILLSLIAISKYNLRKRHT